MYASYLVGEKRLIPARNQSDSPLWKPQITKIKLKIKKIKIKPGCFLVRYLMMVSVVVVGVGGG